MAELLYGIALNENVAIKFNFIVLLIVAAKFQYTSQHFV